MTFPLAELTRFGSGALVALPPRGVDPCEGCADAFTCGPFPCPRFGPEDIDTVALEATKE